jgi:hypothetical protein
MRYMNDGKTMDEIKEWATKRPFGQFDHSEFRKFMGITASKASVLLHGLGKKGHVRSLPRKGMWKWISP